jgi:hypothetical protein
MNLISQQEYNILGSKSSQGTTNSVFYKAWRDYGEVKVFLTPNTNTSEYYELTSYSTTSYHGYYKT